jgi:hypothetical protein
MPTRHEAEKFLGGQVNLSINNTLFTDEELRTLGRFSRKKNALLITRVTEDMTVDQVRNLLRNGSGVSLDGISYHMDQLQEYARISAKLGVYMLVRNADQLTTAQCRKLSRISPSYVILEI